MPCLTGFLFNTLGVITALLAVFYAYFKWSFQYWKRRNIPYLEPTIPFGNFLNPVKKTKAMGEELLELYNKAKSKGWKYCGIYNFAAPIFFPLDLDLAKLILTKDFNYFMDRGLYTNEKDDPLSCQLFALEGKKWRNLRVKLTPTFTSGKMKMMFQTLVDCGAILENYLEDVAVKEKAPLDMKELLGRYSTDIIGSCAFGLDCNSFKDPNSAFRHYGKRSFEKSNFAIVKSIFAQTFPNAARALGIKEIADDVAEFFTKVVTDTITYREKNNISRKDFLQLLIDMKNKEPEPGTDIDESLTMNEIIAQCLLFFNAGFETSSSTMSFALYELANNPSIQDKLRNEINTVLAKHNNQVTYESITDMTYMMQILEETLRKYPAVPLLGRLCVEDYKIPGEDVVIEKGTTVFVPLVGYQYDEEYYKNPTVFDPDNFSEETKKTRNQYSHLPFGEGPRNCIGERFGIMQSKVGLTSIIRKYKVSVNNKTQVPLKMNPKSLVASVIGGIWLNIEKV